MANLTLHHVSVCVEPGTLQPCFYPARWSVRVSFWKRVRFQWRRRSLLASAIDLKRCLNMTCKVFFYRWCRCTSYSFQIFRRQVHPSSRAASWQLACLGKPEGATNILVKTSPTSPKRNICSLACCSFLWQDSSCSSNAELGNSSAGV